VRDLRHGTTALLSAELPARVGRAAINGDGSIVALATPPAPVPPGDPVVAGDLWLIDRERGTVDRLSRPGGGGTAHPAGSGPALSSDGRIIAYVSAAPDLVADDTNDVADVFVQPVAVAAELRLDLVPDTAPAAFRLSGAGFAAGEALEVQLDGTLIATRRATAYGAPAGRVNVPAGTAAGAHVVTVTGRQSGAVAEATLTLPGG
jgi:hypothetical protein